MDNDVTTIGETNFRNQHRAFGIKQADRLHHMYIIGKTGTGKTTLLQNMIRQDIAAGRGCALLDPHGDMVQELVASIPDLDDRLIYLNVPDPEQPWGYNPLAHVKPHRRPLLASGTLEIFKKLWDDAWGVRMEHIFRNVLMTLLDQPHATLGDIQRLFTDDTYRNKALGNITNPRVLDFWQKEYAKYPHRLKAEAIIPIQNKIGGFLSNPILYRVIANPEKEIRLRSVMDEGKVLLVNLAKGQIGEDAANLLGGLLLTSLGLAAYSRAELPEQSRRPFFLYVDEFHNFTTLSLANMMAELRKYGLGMILANQYLHQLDIDVREAVLGNAGTLISFRVGATDATFLQKEFYPTFRMEDLTNLNNYDFYAMLMIDGKPSRGFSGTTALSSFSPTPTA